MESIEPGGAAREIIAALEANGHEAWLVGGCVRDALMGCEPDDLDIATDALPGETERIFKKTAPTGRKYGTVTVITALGSAEVTTFRGEERYEGSRRPSSLRFGVSIREDLARRDFTVNAMAYNPQRGLLDPFGGRGDIERGVIRAVGDPEARFAEDPLRILRAFRFAARLGFAIESGTLAAAEKCMPLCSSLSGERIRGELERILIGDEPKRALCLVQLGLFDAVGVPRAERGKDISFASVPRDIRARWAAFAVASGCGATKLFERLKFSNALERDVSLLLRELRVMPPESPAGIKSRLGEVRPELFRLYVLTYEALSGSDQSAVLAQLDGVLSRREPYTIAMLPIDGNDLACAGVPQGPEIGRMLEKALAMAIDDPGLGRDGILRALGLDPAGKRIESGRKSLSSDKIEDKRNGS